VEVRLSGTVGDKTIDWLSMDMKKALNLMIEGFLLLWRARHDSNVRPFGS
tara:strand:+ start:971 stop:1120 length:150 start_codon:yes stop_codon:yes gene_type:complete